MAAIMRTAAAVAAAIIAAQAGPALAAACAPVENLEKIQDHRIVFIGELHGTHESPRFAASIICGLLERGREVVLALEMPSDLQAQVEAAWSEADAQAARTRLEQMAWWDRKMQDGRSSAAWLELLASGWRMKRDHPELGFLAIDVPAGGPYATRDAFMAQSVRDATQARPKATIVVLAGNVHARRERGTPWNKDAEPAAYLLRDLDMVALNVHYTAGTAWNCTREGCGVNPVSREAPSGRSQVPKIELTSVGGPYDGKYELGEVSAALPVRGVHAAPATAAPPPQ